MPKRLLLSRLTLSPEIWPNTNNKLLRVCNSSSLGLANRIVSSANCRWVTLHLFLPTLKPSNKFLSSAFNNILLNTSATIVNRKGDKGSPCLNGWRRFMLLEVSSQIKKIKQKQWLVVHWLVVQRVGQSHLYYLTMICNLSNFY